MTSNDLTAEVERSDEPNGLGLTKPSGGPWQNEATAQVADLLKTDPSFLDSITHDWLDAEQEGADTMDAAAKIEATEQRIRDQIKWWDSEMDEPEFEAAVEAADSADLTELAEAVIIWAAQQQAKERAAWSNVQTAKTAKVLERQEVLKVLSFQKAEVAPDGDLDAVVRFIEKEIESWRARPGGWPSQRDYETAQRADVREIAATFLRWTEAGNVSSWEALSF